MHLKSIGKHSAILIPFRKTFIRKQNLKVLNVRDHLIESPYLRLIT